MTSASGERGTSTRSSTWNRTFRTLAASPGRVFSRRMLIEALWKSADYRDPRTIDVHVRHLREKLEAEPREPEYILTVRGVGYRFRDS